MKKVKTIFGVIAAVAAMTLMSFGATSASIASPDATSGEYYIINGAGLAMNGPANGVEISIQTKSVTAYGTFTGYSYTGGGHTYIQIERLGAGGSDSGDCLTENTSNGWLELETCSPADELQLWTQWSTDVWYNLDTGLYWVSDGTSNGDPVSCAVTGGSPNEIQWYRIDLNGSVD